MYSSFLHVLLSQHYPRGTICVLFSGTMFFRFLFHFTMLYKRPFPFYIRLFVLNFRNMRIKRLYSPNLFRYLYHHLVRSRLTFVLPPRHNLIFNISRFRHREPRLLMNERVFCRWHRVPGTTFHIFRNKNHHIIYHTSLNRPTFRTLMTIGLIFYSRIWKVNNLLRIIRLHPPHVTHQLLNLSAILRNSPRKSFPNTSSTQPPIGNGTLSPLNSPFLNMVLPRNLTTDRTFLSKNTR